MSSTHTCVAHAQNDEIVECQAHTHACCACSELSIMMKVRDVKHTHVLRMLRMMKLWNVKHTHTRAAHAPNCQ